MIFFESMLLKSLLLGGLDFCVTFGLIFFPVDWQVQDVDLAKSCTTQHISRLVAFVTKSGNDDDDDGLDLIHASERRKLLSSFSAVCIAESVPSLFR